MPKPVVGGKRKRGHVQRYLKSLESQIQEGTKTTLLIRGHKTSQRVNDVLADLHLLHKPHTKLFGKKNQVLPFEDESSLEFLCQKNNAGLFVLANHNKKRPNNLTLGRMFDGHLLDMYEYGVDSFVSLADIRAAAPAGQGMAKSLNSKPVVVFQGDRWEQDERLRNVRGLMLELFRGEVIEAFELPAADHAVVCTAVGDKIHIRNYHITFKKSSKGSKCPDTVLLPMGPSIDLSARRNRTAAPALMKMAMKQAKGARPKKVKNVERDELEGRLGRVHMQRQDYSKLVTRSRFKGLKRGRGEVEGGAAAAAGEGEK